MSMSVPDVINRYFAALNGRDKDELLALFTLDAVVVDEGQTWRGMNEVSKWAIDVAFRFEYTAGVLSVEAAADGAYVARVRLEGNFPGGTVELNVRFDVDGDRIHRLENSA
jgi:ketosteroid isomerase-like protein